MWIKWLPLFAVLCVVASAQVSNNQSLSGKYAFRQVLLITDGIGECNRYENRHGHHNIHR